MFQKKNMLIFVAMNEILVPICGGIPARILHKLIDAAQTQQSCASAKMWMTLSNKRVLCFLHLLKRLLCFVAPHG